MGIQYSIAVNNARLDVVESTIGASPTLEVRSGVPPANAAAADTGTVLATLTLPADWMNAAASASKTLAGSWQDASADATGLGGHFRIKAGATTHMQGNFSETWVISTAYVVNEQVANGGNCYRCTTAGTSAGSGGPTGTGGSISDGTCVWAYVGTADMIGSVSNFTAGQSFSITTFTITAGSQ
jgi:hypothetical protein